MSVYANGQLLYGFVRDNETEELFAKIIQKWEDEDGEDTASFEEMYGDLQEKHHISLSSVGYSSVEILSAFSASAYAKNIDYEKIEADAMLKAEEYASNIKQFLEALDIDASQYQPNWCILAYMD
jgi:hypothetical protein